MKKKTYQQPEITVIELVPADIIAQSGDFKINPGEGYEEEDW